MKIFYFNIQSKGGAGKSMLTYLQGLKNEKNEKSLFIDLDSSTKTSVKQLAFLKDQKRIAEVTINDSQKKIDREKLFDVIEKLAIMEQYEEFYVDFGAPESQQLPSIFNFDFTVEEFKDFECSVEAKFVFNIIIAGGASYTSCMQFTEEVVDSLKGKFEVNLWVNEHSFTNYEKLVEEVKEYAKVQNKNISSVKLFGNIAVDRSSGQNIIESVKQGGGLDGFKGFATKAIIKREIDKI